MEALREYLKEQRGRASRLAEGLDIFPSAITQWEEVPLRRVLDIERLTGVSRHDLRPDVFGPSPKRLRKAAA